MNLKRVALGGWDQERFVALFRAGQNALDANYSFSVAKAAWLQAYETDPNRVETLYEIAEWFVHTHYHAHSFACLCAHVTHGMVWYGRGLCRCTSGRGRMGPHR